MTFTPSAHTITARRIAQADYNALIASLGENIGGTAGVSFEVRGYPEISLMVGSSSAPTTIGTIGTTGIKLGTRTTGFGTATPLNINLGDTFANSAGDATKLKLAVHDDGTNRYGLTVSNSQLELIAPAGATHVFYITGTGKIADVGATGFNLASGRALKVNGTQVVGAQGAAVADATGGSTVDTEARAAINALLARLRTHGLIAP